MSLKRRGVLAVICLSFLTSVTFAEELDNIDEGTAAAYGLHLAEKFADAKDKQVKIQIDPDKAIGLALDGDGIILVPAKSLKEGEPNPDVETEKGSGLAYLFMSPRFNPVIDGKPIPKKQLRTVKFDSDDGEKTATCLILAVRHIEGDDWRLYVYGADKKPIIDVKFKEADEEVDGLVHIATTEAKDGVADLVVTVYKKYSASFKIGHKFD